MAIAFVDKATFASAVSAATYTFTGFSSDIQVGEFLAIGMGAFTTLKTVSTASDNSTQAGTANTYTVRATISGSVAQQAISLCLVTRKILTTDTITITISGASASRSGLLLRFTGVASTSVDQGASAVSIATSPITLGPTAALSGAGELAVGFSTYKGSSTTPTFSDSTSGYNAVQGVNSGAASNMIETCAGYNLSVGAAATTDAHTWVTGIGQLNGEILTFTPAAAGGTTAHYLSTLGVGT